jgi:hypothetical protein
MPEIQGEEMPSPDFQFHDESPIPQLDPNMVTGAIRWNKAMGKPDGDIRNAFVILCHHVNLVHPHGTQDPQVGPLNEWHPVSAWVGPDDGDHHQILFVTDARKPRGYLQSDTAPNHSQNYLDVSFSPSMVWKNPAHTIAGIKLLTPPQIVFTWTGRPQSLPDIQVLKILHSHFR